jgi:hypothetical protein
MPRSGEGAEGWVFYVVEKLGTPYLFSRRRGETRAGAALLWGERGREWREARAAGVSGEARTTRQVGERRGEREKEKVK